MPGVRRAVAAAIAVALVAAPLAGARPLLGLTGDGARFQAETGQQSLVHQVFLGWGQGQAYGRPLASLIPTLGPVPMLALSADRVTPAEIASGAGDAYLAALNAAVAAWGRGIYVRPMAEMNNPGNPWSRDPAAYRRAFARIDVVLHGGPAVAARLRALGLPAYRGPALAANPFPRLRVVWCALSNHDAIAPYWPGDAYADVVGADIYAEGGGPPFAALGSIAAFARAQHKPFAIPEWGLLAVDDASFVRGLCGFVHAHAVEALLFYRSRPGSRVDLGDEPAARAAARSCLTPLGGALPAWAR